ncbi:MAG: hypothetical protein BWK80_19160, partial [Desulfobacteraceae bacterium IS3]
EVKRAVAVKMVEEGLKPVTACKVLKISKAKAANDLVNLFVHHGILKEISGKIRYRRFLFENYINLFK